MKKTRLELILSDNTLSVNGRKIRLDDSLSSEVEAQIKGKEDYLELRYDNKDEYVAQAEAEKIYPLLEEQKLTNTIQALYSPDDLDGEYKDYQSVTLVGDFDWAII